MAELSYTKLTDDDIQRRLNDLDGWTIEAGMLTKTFAFDAYAAGAVFAGAVAHVADRLNHHPDLLIGYRKVRVSVLTHDAGGLTSYDFELARRIDAVA